MSAQDHQRREALLDRLTAPRRQVGSARPLPGATPRAGYKRALEVAQLGRNLDSCGRVTAEAARFMLDRSLPVIARVPEGKVQAPDQGPA